jgi:hypothetical protein
MGYTISYIFGETTSIGILQGNGNRCLLTLTFTVQGTGNNVTYLASDRGLRLIKMPSLKIDFDFDEFLMMPQECVINIYDENDELDDLLYEGANVDSVEKDFFVKFEVKYGSESPNGATANYIERFSGHNIVENLDEERIYKTHKFTALPRTNILNQTLIFKRDWDATKFDANTQTTYPNNPLELTCQKIGSASKWDWVYLYQIIGKIFQLINPNISTTIIQEWLFYGSNRPEYTQDPLAEVTSSSLTFNDLICDHNWIGSIFAEDKHSEIKSIGDLLKMLAFEFGCMTGLLSESKAFFIQLFHFDENDLQVMGTEITDSYHKKYKYSKIDFARIECAFYKQDASVSNRYVEQSYRPYGYSPVINSDKNSGENGLEKTIVTVINSKQTSGPYNIGASISNLKAVITGDPSQYYSIFAVKNPMLDLTTLVFPYDCASGFFPLVVSLAEYHYNLKGILYKAQVHEWTFEGVDYDFIKGFQRDSYDYKIIGMEEDHETGLTKIEAIRISELTIAGGEGSSGLDITNPLAVYSLVSFGSEANFTYTQAGEADEVIGIFNEDEWLEGFYINLDHVFLSGTITKFEIYDGTETLLKLENIMGKLTQLVKPQLITRVKKYTAADTLYLHIEGTNPTQGDGQIIIRKMKRETA